jgi:hypothetical protein
MHQSLKTTLIAAMLLAGAAVLFRAAITVPGERAVTPMPSGPQRLALERCEEHVLMVHDVRWAAACMALAEQNEARYAKCLEDPAIVGNPQLGKDYCKRTLAEADGSAECTLPPVRAAPLNAILRDDEEKCAVEARAAAP